MSPWCTEKFGNASSRNHTYGWEAEETVEIARESVAAIIGSLPKEIIFTSGATEANNIALQGAAKNYQNQGLHIITLKTEHKAVMDICQNLSKDGFDITYLPVDKGGILNVNKFEDAIFLSLTNKILNNPNNVISAGINAKSQFDAIKKFQEINELKETLVLIPKKDYKEEIEEAIIKSKIKFSSFTGGFFNNLISAAVCSGFNGSGTTP